MPHALLVEHDPATARVVKDTLQDEGFTHAGAPSLAGARAELKKKIPDVVLVNLRLPDGSGMDLLKDLEPHPAIELVVVNEYASVETPVEALRFGLSDYIAKPIDVSRLSSVLARIARTCELKSEIDSRAEHFGSLWGASAAMREVYHLISRVAPTDASVFLTGESGTGKELAARTIHKMSERRDAPFIALNCGAIAPTLVESELFGHEKGSFTGSDRLHKGHFERAHGGTIFLDEITEMSPDLQVKLLRILENDTLLRIGGETPVKVDVRVIAATNLDPENAVSAGKLRGDLLYRLMVFPIRLPPLRERGDDVILLAETFLAKLNAEKDTAKKLTDSAKERLRAKYWPGNVRQLRNTVQHAFIMTDGDWIGPERFLADLGSPEAPPPDPLARAGAPRISFDVGLKMEEVERRLILATLELAKGSRKKTAEILGISSKTLYTRLLQYAR